MKHLGQSVFIFCLSWLVAQSSLALPGHKRILAVHSYHPQHISMPKRNSGLQSVLDRFPDIDIEYFYMDTKRRSSLAEKMEAGRAARAKIDASHPDVVIAFDDNAQEYVVKYYTGAGWPQIVFAGVNGEPEEYGFPAPNITGILERTYPEQTLSLLVKINPEIKKVACISDDSTTANEVMAYIKSAKMPLEIIGFDQPATFESWKQTILRYEHDPSVQAFLIPLYHTVKSENRKERVAPEIVMRWTVGSVTKPIGGLWPFATQDGALCAVTVDLAEHGMVAAKMALRILNGEKAGQIPMIKNQDGYVILNLREANRLGIIIPYAIIQAADRILE